MRNADELSTTVAPARTENSARSTPLKLCSFNSRTASAWPRNLNVLPAERAEANSRSSDNGKARSSRQRINSTPTAPVAPTIATTGADGARPSVITQILRFINDEAPSGQKTLPQRIWAVKRLA